MRLHIGIMIVALTSVVVSGCINQPADDGIHAAREQALRRRGRDVLIACVDEDQRAASYDRFLRVRVGVSTCGARRDR